MLAVLLNHSPPYFLRQNRTPNLVLTNMVSSQRWPTEPPVPTSSAGLYQGVPWEYIAEWLSLQQETSVSIAGA